jgi:hypothetical protein
MDTVKKSTVTFVAVFCCRKKNRKILITRCCVGEKENTRKNIFFKKEK